MLAPAAHHYPFGTNVSDRYNSGRWKAVMNNCRSISLSLVAMLVVAALTATQAVAVEQYTIALGDDLFVGGQNVVVRQAAAGDMIVAGSDVQLQAPASGDLVAVGRIVHLTDTARQDAYIAGSQVTIAGTVERNARLAGGTVTVAGPARIEGNISAAGGEVTIAGSVGGYVQAMAGRIFINGPVGGDVQLAGEEIRLGPQADIAGTLRYRSEENIEQHPSARIGGGIERLPQPEESDGALGWLRGVWGIGLMILAAVLVAVLPSFTRRSSQAASTRFGPTLLIGLAAVVFIPLLLLVAVVSVIGIPLALALLLIYLLLLLLGFVVAGIALGDAALHRLPPDRRERAAWRSLGAAVAVAVLVLATFIPIVGGIIALLALVIGIGAMVTPLGSRESAATA